MALTDAKIRALKPKDKAYKASDFGGLYISVTTKGSKLWKLKYRYNGKEGKLSFGPYPDISLKQARDMRDDARAQLAIGINPAITKAEAKTDALGRSENSFNRIADRFVDKSRKEGKSDATLKKLGWLLKEARADFGHMPIGEITPQIVLKTLRKREKAEHYETAQRMRSRIGGVFRYAVASGLCENDPNIILDVPTCFGYVLINRRKTVMSILSQPQFHSEEAAYEYVEAHIWPNGAVCPRCGENKRVNKLKGKSTRIGVHKCYSCRKPFTVKINTIFESSHVKMNLWLQAIYLMSSSKKGISTQQLHRTLGVTLKTAWFMTHRIREAMRDGDLSPLGGNGLYVEADETYFGKKSCPQELPASRKGRPYLKGGVGPARKRAIVSLVERGGEVRSFHVKQANKENVAGIVSDNIKRESVLNTDESPLYKAVGKDFMAHQTTKHSAGEYVRGGVHSNTVENYFSVFKRGMKGTYQHCAEKHLHRYLAEFDFRYNNRSGLGVNDTERAVNALRGVVGKRLTYQTASAR